MDLERQPVALHPRRRVHRVSKKAIPRHLDSHLAEMVTGRNGLCMRECRQRQRCERTYHASAAGSSVQSDADLQLLLRFVSDLESLHSLENLKGHPRNLSRVVLTVSQWKSRHHHVSVTNRLNLEMHKVNIQKIRKAYLIYIKLGYDVVKECVQIIEQFDNLKRIIKGD